MGWVSNRKCGSQFPHNKHLFYHDSFVCDGYVENNSTYKNKEDTQNVMSTPEIVDVGDENSI